MRVAAGLVTLAGALLVAGCGSDGQPAGRSPMTAERQLTEMARGVKAMQAAADFEPETQVARFVDGLGKADGDYGKVAGLIYQCKEKGVSFELMEDAYWAFERYYRRSGKQTKEFFQVQDRLGKAIIAEPSAATGTYELVKAWNRLLMKRSDQLNPAGPLAAFTTRVAGTAASALSAAARLRKQGGSREKFERACREAGDPVPYLSENYEEWAASQKNVGGLLEAANRVELAFRTTPEGERLRRQLKKRFPEGLALPEPDGGL